MNSVDRFSKNAQIPNFMKIHPVGAKLFCVNGRQTDMMKLIVTFSNFANTHKNVWSYISLPPYIFMKWYIIRQKENFICTFMVCLITLWVAQTVVSISKVICGCWIENEWNKAVMASDGLLLGFCTLKMEAVCSSEASELWTTTCCTNQTKTIICSTTTVKTSELQLWPTLNYCHEICLEKLVDCKDSSSWCLG